MRTLTGAVEAFGVDTVAKGNQLLAEVAWVPLVQEEGLVLAEQALEVILTQAVAIVPSLR